MDKKDKEADTLRTIRHDINNQLSNINMLLEQLKYEMQNAPSGQLEYLEMIKLGIAKIDAVLKSTE